MTQLSHLRWIEKNETIRIAGERRPLPLVYVFEKTTNPLIAPLRLQEPSAINFKLPVARESVPLSPSEFPASEYRLLTPAQRRWYLNWLFGECCEWPPCIAFVFLYLGGLERRALVDEKSLAAVFGQVLHLRDYYDRYKAAGGIVDRGFETTTTAFLWYLLVRFPAAFSLDYVRAVFEQSLGEANEDHLAAVLSWCASQGIAMPAWLAYELTAILPEAKRSVVLRRAEAEHRRLFDRYFFEHFPNGMPLDIAKRDRTFHYHPRNVTLYPMKHAGPHPLGRTSQFAKLTNLWNDAIDALKKFSSVLAKQDIDTLSINAWEALPPTLQAVTEHPLAEEVDVIFNAAKGVHGHAIQKIDGLAIIHQLETDTLTLGDSRMIAATVEASGLGIEPDARITKRKYKRGDQVILFPGKPTPNFDSARYLAAAYMLQVGLAIAVADEEVAEAEADFLTHQLQDSFALTPGELKRLDAWKSLLLAEKSGPADVPRPPKAMSTEHRQALGKFIVAMVVADGVVLPAEITAGRLLFARLGLEPADIDRTLAATTTSAGVDDLVRVQKARPGKPGEAIPPSPTPAVSTLSIDREAVARIMLETREVAMLLAEAMAAEEEAGAPEQMPPPVAALPTSGPPARYSAFYVAIIARPSWPMAEVDTLAHRHNLMVSGAVEAINEWAFERWNANLLYEDGDALGVEVDLLQQP